MSSGRKSWKARLMLACCAELGWSSRHEGDRELPTMAPVILAATFAKKVMDCGLGWGGQWGRQEGMNKDEGEVWSVEKEL